MEHWIVGIQCSRGRLHRGPVVEDPARLHVQVFGRVFGEHGVEVFDGLDH